MCSVEPKENLCDQAVPEAASSLLPLRRKQCKRASHPRGLLQLQRSCLNDSLTRWHHWKQRQGWSVTAMGPGLLESRTRHHFPTSSLSVAKVQLHFSFCMFSSVLEQMPFRTSCLTSYYSVHWQPHTRSSHSIATLQVFPFLKPTCSSVQVCTPFRSLTFTLQYDI